MATPDPIPNQQCTVHNYKESAIRTMDGIHTAYIPTGEAQPPSRNRQTKGRPLMRQVPGSESDEKGRRTAEQTNKMDPIRQGSKSVARRDALVHLASIH